MAIVAFFKENPKTAGSLYLSIATIILMLLNIPLIWVVTLVLGSRQIYQARKAKEHKKFMILGYVLLYAPVLLWVISAILFASAQLERAKAF